MKEYILALGNDDFIFSTTEVNDHLKLSVTNIATEIYLSLLIRAVTSFAENFTRRDFLNKKYSIYLDDWEEFEIKKSKLQSVVSVAYYDEDGTLQTLSSEKYYTTLSNEYSKLLFTDEMDYPTLYDRKQVVKITITAGYGADADNIPSELKAAVLAHLARIYQNRGDCPDEANQLSNWVLENLPPESRLIYSMYKIQELI